MDNLLNFLKILYFESYPINNEFKKRFESHGISFEADLQKRLLKSTIHHPISLKFSPAKRYQQAFLKYFISELEQRGTEIIDELYESYTAIISEPQKTEDTAYKTYFIDKESYTVLKENVNFISQGTTGLCTWQAAMYLTEWAVENKSLLRNRKVLELGSGLGLTGLVVQKACATASYIFTDCHPQVLKTLLENIEINLHVGGTHSGPHDSAERKPQSQDYQGRDFVSLCSGDKDTSGHTINASDESMVNECSLCDKTTNNGISTIVENPEDWFCKECGRLALTNNMGVFDLNWEEVQAIQLEKLGENIDIILASDVVYDTRIIPSLVKTLIHVLVRDSSVAYIASTVRNEETNKSFLEALDAHGLQHEHMEGPSTELFYYDKSVPVDLLKIRKNTA